MSLEESHGHTNNFEARKGPHGKSSGPAWMKASSLQRSCVAPNQLRQKQRKHGALHLTWASDLAEAPKACGSPLGLGELLAATQPVAVFPTEAELTFECSNALVDPSPSRDGNGEIERLSFKKLFYVR